MTTDENRAIIELRKKTNWVKGAKGRFAGSVSVSGTARMTKREKAIVSSAICTDHPTFEPGSRQNYNYGDFFYSFTVVMPGVYDFDIKIKVDGNEDLIRHIRRNNNGDNT